MSCWFPLRPCPPGEVAVPRYVIKHLSECCQKLFSRHGYHLRSVDFSYRADPQWCGWVVWVGASVVWVGGVGGWCGWCGWAPPVGPPPPPPPRESLPSWGFRRDLGLQPRGQRAEKRTLKQGALSVSSVAPHQPHRSPAARPPPTYARRWERPRSLLPRKSIRSLPELPHQGPRAPLALPAWRETEFAD